MQQELVLCRASTTEYHLASLVPDTPLQAFDCAAATSNHDLLE